MSNTEEVVINEPYGFIYITTNMVNGKRYLGLRSASKGKKKSELHKKHIAESKMGDKNPMYIKEFHSLMKQKKRIDKHT